MEESRAMTRGLRLSALDASFLHLEKAGARLHVASVTVFDGPTPPYDELLAHIEAPLRLAPRLRRASRPYRGAPAPRPAPPPAARGDPARPGPAGVGRRPALQPAVSP